MKLSISLSSKSINDAIKQLETYKKDLLKKNEEFVKRLAVEGVQIARSQVIDFDAIYTGELLNSLSLKKGDVIQNGSSYIIFTDCPWAKYVEFGTGIIGEQSPHPNTELVGWRYDVNEHGEKGWYYFKDNEWHWTQGMPSKPFMYNTSIELRQKIVQIAKEVFG